MSLYVVRPADPPPGTDWQAAVPGEYLYNVTGIVALLATTGAPFDRLKDDSGLGNDGTYHSTLAGFPLSVPGLVAGNGAVQWGPFGGPTGRSYATIPVPLIDWAGDFTVECWVAQASPAAPGDSIFVAYDQLGRNALEVQLDVGAQGAVLVFRNNVAEHTFTTPGTFPPDGAGHHVVVTYAGTTMTVYVDGGAVALAVDNPHLAQTVLATGTTISGTPFGQPASTAISDEVAIYNHALSAGQVAVHHAAAAVSFAAWTAAVLGDTPYGFYHLDDQSNQVSRQVGLSITDGNRELERIPTGFAEVALGGPFLYSWQPGLAASAETANGETITVAIPALVLPAGYTIGTATLDLAASDQWSDVTIWWDSNIMDAQAGLGAYLFPPPVHLVYHQEPH